MILPTLSMPISAPITSAIDQDPSYAITATNDRFWENLLFAWAEADGPRPCTVLALRARSLEMRCAGQD